MNDFFGGDQAMKAIVFDAYGTLFDVYSVTELADRLYPGRGSTGRTKQVRNWV